MNRPHPVRFDHLVIAAGSCQQGVDWLDTIMGIRIPAGGKHSLMGTHNHLSALSVNSFLEVIAIDPAAPEPSRPRWFSLDNPETRQAIQDSPRLLTWVVATEDIDKSMQQARRAGVEPGEAVTLSRDDLSWRLALPADGSMAMHGLFPVLIEWPAGLNPVSRMQNQGLTLQSLHLSTQNPGLLQEALKAIGWCGTALPIHISAGEPCVQADLVLADREYRI